MEALTLQTQEAIKWVRDYQREGGTMSYHMLAIIELADALDAALNGGA